HRGSESLSGPHRWTKRLHSGNRYIRGHACHCRARGAAGGADQYHHARHGCPTVGRGRRYLRCGHLSPWTDAPPKSPASVDRDTSSPQTRGETGGARLVVPSTQSALVVAIGHSVKIRERSALSWTQSFCVVRSERVRARTHESGFSHDQRPSASL